MGAAKSAARSESAREVLSRRSAVGAGRKQGERANENQSRMKPIFKEYNREAMDEMSKVFTVKTTVHKTNLTRPDGSHVAPIIRFHRDNDVELKKEKGIVQGRTQVRESELIDIFAQFRNDSGIANEIAKELNISVDESLSLLRSARLPKYSKFKGEPFAF